MSSRRPARRRRGRPQRLPEDLTSSALGYDFSPEARLAWLLATSRLHAADETLHYQDTFSQRLCDLGITVDNTQVSRWESGLRRVPWSTVRAYERLLGLPKAQLVSVGLALDRLARVECVAEPVEVHQDLLDAKLERTLSGSATGGDWFLLAANMSGLQRVFLPSATWQQLCTRLVNELVRSVGLGQHRRSGAAQLFLEHTMAQPHMSIAIGELVTDPHAQWLMPVTDLIGRMDDPLAARMLLRLADSDRALVRESARELVPLQLTRGALDDSTLGVVLDQTVRALRAPRQHVAPLIAYDVAASLDDAAFTRLTRAVLDPSVSQRLVSMRTHGLLVTPATARTTVRRVTAALQGAAALGHHVERDRMLETLLREALFHVHRERRQMAAEVLAASPYAAAIGTACAELASDLSDELAEHAWRLASHLPVQTAPHRLVEQALAHRHPGSRVQALRTVSQSVHSLDPTSAERVRATVMSSTTQAAQREQLRVLAMGAPDQLDHVATTAATLDLRPAVQWWRSTGSALRDPDVGVADVPVADPDWIPESW